MNAVACWAGRITLQSVTRKFQVHPETGEGAAGIYAHIPFCQSKCPYCSFVSYQDMSIAVQNRYMQALKHQAHDMAVHPWSRARKFHSLFIGGGTPSSVDSEKTADFIKVCLEGFDFTARENKEPEVTLEANPNSLDAAMLDRLRQSGVNRLSIGMQSFSDNMLRNIGRIHTAGEGIKAYESARAAGFDNINLDLMYGLPSQDAAQWEKTLQQAVDLAPEHLSVYELTIEQGTPFAEAVSRNRLDLPHEEVILSMFEQAQKVLSANGYRQYEISNYARNGFECIHNINYWENGSYIGLGGGAVSCFSGVRIKSEDNPVRFTQMIDTGLLPFKEAEFLPHFARFRETVIMGLRMTAGVSITRLENQFGMTPQTFYGETLNSLISRGFLEESDNRLRLTQKGLLLANWVMAQLV
jgi:oxygen-independent coproporphyrinogen-3 oxidase